MRQIWVGCILLSSVVGTHAATLGRHSGAAVIGRPLDLRVQTLLSPGEDISDLCAQSEVFYGDTQVSPGSVRVTPQKSAPDAEASLRIQASVPVDEPVVTVYVRTGCNAPFSRRYVLLADPVTEPQAAPVATASNPVVAGTATPRTLPSASSIVESGATASAMPSTTRQQPSALGSAQPSTKVERPRRPKAETKLPVPVVRRPAAATPRLELEPVDVSLPLDRDPALKLSVSMLSSPAASDEERAAAARLWKAINASPEDILRDNQKLEVLEAEAKGLREQEARNKAEIEAITAQLEQTRFLNWLVWGLGASLLAALLALFFFWRKRGLGLGRDDQAARAWWAAANAEKEQDEDDGKPGRTDVDLDLDLDLEHGRASRLDSLNSLREMDLDADSAPALLTQDKREFAPSQLGVSRSVATEELFDVQQQADFFVSLGENEQAIQVLKNHLAESQEPSALAYLDLFKLYHKLGRADDYEQLRRDFNRLFNASAPGFAQYTDVSRGLESYEVALGRIQALWPQPRVLELIEKSIFREPGDASAEVFDLEAYRELLLLYAIAKDVIQRDRAEGPASGDFEHTAIKPLKAASNRVVAAAVAAHAESVRETQPQDVLPPASPHLGLDVDLDELMEISAFEASLPEVAAPVQPTAKPARTPGKESDMDLSNLIDFEMPDFMPPVEDGRKPGKKS